MNSYVIVKFFMVFSTSLVLPSCGGTINQTFYLQDAEVKGPINAPPIHITNDRIPGTIIVSPRLNVSGFSEISANTGTERYRNTTQDSLFRGKNKNLLWKLPTISFGLDLDLALTSRFGIAAGVNYSKIEGQQLIGGSLGLSFVTEKENMASRIELGILVNEMFFDAKSVVVTETDYLWSNPETSVYYYRDIAKNSTISIYAGLTLNSKMREFPFNVFFNLSFFTQSLLDYEPQTQTDLLYFILLTHSTKTDKRGEIMSAFFSFTPGIFFEFTEWSRFVLGARLMYDFGLDSSSKQFLVLPVLQCDFQF